ncbi:hypothetical protein Ccrd_013786 [Cynara cardunculus var. scolymus]|uniref:DUF8040 domain-containing protein n=1 Tax=Cynara cardunculus var. scolymus TaxID=59895 RepID=A0A103YEY1_CYNCS|nr:hypothetical protein Ccrd_013786 [Cynara cardunculus var. scolymus]
MGEFLQSCFLFTNLENVRSHGADLALIVGIGGLGIVFQIIIRMDSDDSDLNGDNEVNWVEEENKWLLSCAIAIKGIIISHKLNSTRMPCRTSSRTGNIFIHEVLNGHPRRCYEDFILNVPVFKMLCSDIATRYGLKATRNICIEESVGIFLMTLAYRCGNRLIQETVNHSGETIHGHFHAVLKVMLKLGADIIKPNANYKENVPVHILNNSRYYPTIKVLPISCFVFDPIILID